MLRALHVEGVRLATVVGQRGIGKTRLATEVAREYARAYGSAVEVVDDASPAAVVDALADPSVQVLATAPETLGVEGERVFELRPLAVSPAVELLRRRAEEIEPTFHAPWQTLAELVQRVGRVPLALELAAEDAARDARTGR